MKVEVEKFKDGRSLKLLVRFEESTNFWPEKLTWVPKKDEVEHIQETLQAIDEYNKNKKTHLQLE
jgi:hypothetical protein